MKTLRRSAMTLACVLALSGLVFSSTPSTQTASPAGPVRYVIGISPWLDRSVKDDVYRRIITFILEDLPLNSSLSLYDAFHLRSISQVEVPDVSAFRSAKTRANQFKAQIAKLKAFLAADTPKESSPNFTLDQAIRFPQFLDFVSDNLLSGSARVVVIVLGNPLYLDPKEPGFSMINGYFPSDGHLLAPREQTVFGLKDHTHALQGVTVHFGYFNDPWLSEIHQEKITRFWALYLKQQGAQLATFCGDLPTLFNALHASSHGSGLPPKDYSLDLSQSKIEMLRITRNPDATDWITRDTLATRDPDAPSIKTGPMKIGIRWKGNIDLDLYASPRPNTDTLFFEHTRSPEGYYAKDYRSAPGHEYEFIEFESPVDPLQVEAMINFYQGSLPFGPSGEVRIEFDHKIYSGNFTLRAAHGNQGRSDPAQGEFWTRIDIPALLKLRPRTAGL